MTDISKIDAAQSGFEWQATQFEQNKAKLYRPDGAQVYGDAEHNERLQTLLQPLTEAAKHVEATATAALEAAKAAKALEHSDPLSSLTNDELQRASGLKPFVDEFVANTPLEKVAARLNAILATGNRAEIAVYFTATQKRIEAIKRASMTGNSTVALAGLKNVLPVIDAMGQRLTDPKIAKAAADAAQLEKRAHDANLTAQKRLRALNGETAKESASFAQMVRSF